MATIYRRRLESEERLSDKAKAWALNVQYCAQVTEMMAARATWAPKSQDTFKAPSSPAYRSGGQAARRVIAGMQDLDNSRKRGRGMVL